MHKLQILIVITICVLFISCSNSPKAQAKTNINNDTTPPSSDQNNEQVSSSSEPVNLISLYPNARGIYQYDTDKILVQQSNTLQIFNICNGDTEEVNATFKLNNPIFKLSENSFYYFDGTKVSILNNKLQIINQIKVPEKIGHTSLGVSPNGKNVVYLNSERHLMLLSQGVNTPKDIGTGAIPLIFLDDTHVITPSYNEKCGYQIVDVKTGQSKFTPTNALFPEIICGTKLLLTEDWDSGELPTSGAVNVLSTQSPFNVLNIKMKQQVESGHATLSNNGNYIISYITAGPYTNVPEKSVLYTIYSTTTGDVKWSKLIKTTNDLTNICPPLFLESSNTLIHTIADKNDEFLIEASLVKLN